MHNGYGDKDLNEVGPGRKYETFQDLCASECGDYKEKAKKGGSLNLKENLAVAHMPHFQRPAPFKIGKKL